MTERQRAIAETFDAFRKARRQPDNELVADVVSLVLRAGGQRGLSEEERRYLESCALAGWSTPFEVQEPTGDAVFDGLPDATMAPMSAPAAMSEKRGLFD